MVDVVLDVLRRVPGPPDQVVLLVQPTQPLRQRKHLEEALDYLETWQSLASVVEVEPAQKLYFEGFEPVMPGYETERRQDGSQTYACDGTVYGFRREWFLDWGEFRVEGETMMYEVAAAETCRLDTSTDWAIAELRVAAADALLAKRRDPVQLQLPLGI
jgi:CMP-N-acetylneuraminic acid synthetase